MYPLGIVMVLLVGALVFLLRGRRRVGVGLLGAGLVVLWVFSMPAVGNWLVWQLERQWPDTAVEELPRADAVVVLGGAFGSGNGQWTYPSAGSNVDRYWHAARIFHAGKAPRVILSGGRQPHLTGGLTEAQAGAMFLGDMGVPAAAMVLDNASLTTAEHDDNLRVLIAEQDIRSLLVVTSAIHMRRAMISLGRLGVEVVPVAAGFSAVADPPFTLRRYLPDVSGLRASTWVVHEVVGYWYEGLKGKRAKG